MKQIGQLREGSNFPGIRRVSRVILGGSAYLALLGLPVAAQAQDASRAPDASSADIVVTATRQESTINKVPISIQAFSKEALDVRGARSVDDIFRLTPGVTFGRDISGGTSVAIRGISSPAGAATTGIYIDDTPIQVRAVGFAQTPIYPVAFDLQRVEVLRGPQGTQFGAGSEGGTIRFITTAPSLSGISFYGRSEIATTQGGDQSYELGGAVNVPLSDKIAIRLMAYHRRDGGYVDHVQRTTGILRDKNSDWMNTNAFRAAVLFQPVDGLKIVPSFYYQHQYQNDAQAATEYASNFSKGIYVNNWNANSPYKSNYKLPALNVSYDFGNVTATGNVSYFIQDNQIDRDYGDFLVTLLGGTVTPATGIAGYPDYVNQTFYVHRQRNLNGELRLQSHNNGWLNWSVGAYFGRQKQYEGEFLPETSQANFDRFVMAYLGIPGAGLGGGPLVDGKYSYVSNLNSVDEQKAIFGEVTIKPIDHIKLILGARYTHSTFSSFTQGFGPYAGAGTAGSTANNSETENKFLPKASLEYEFNDSNRVYFTASKGFRPGGGQGQVAGRCAPDLAAYGYNQVPTEFKPDEVWSYELGTKNKLFGNKLSINASVYMIDWSQIQQTVYLLNCGGNFIANLGKARSTGFDLDMEIRPARGLLLQLAAGYNKAVFTQSINTPPVGGVVTPIVSKGNSLGNPPWQVSLGAQYDFEAFAHNLYVRGDYQYIGKETRPTYLRDPRNLLYSANYIGTPTQNNVNVRVGIRTGGMDISAFINNLTNDNPVLGRVQFGANADLINMVRIPRPRTYGLTLTYRH